MHLLAKGWNGTLRGSPGFGGLNRDIISDLWTVILVLNSPAKARRC